MNGVTEINEANFQKEVINSNVPVLVDFFAPWCGPCKALAPVLESFAGDYKDRVKVVKVNVDEAQRLATDYRIRGVPTMVFFKGGAAVDSVVGLTSIKALRDKIDALALPLTATAK